MPKLLLSAKFSAEEKQAHGFTNSYLHKLVLRFVQSLLEAVDEVQPVYILSFFILFVLFSNQSCIMFYMQETDGEICAKIVKSLTKCIEVGHVIN